MKKNNNFFSLLDKIELAVAISFLTIMVIVGAFIGYNYLEFCCSSILIILVFAGVSVLSWYLYDWLKVIFKKSGFLEL